MVRVVWDGERRAHHSLANVNRELTRRLSTCDGIELVPDAGVGADVYVRHRWPPDFERPQARRFVLVQPWEYGRVPDSWVQAIAETVDELWVHSRFVRDAYARSGVDTAGIQLIPLGVDTGVFHPGAEPFPISTEKTFRFLFVGGTIERKGFDLLMRAYAEEFTSDDDVSLVVKDFFYGAGGRELVRDLRRDPGSPEVRYGYGTMEPRRLGGLFTACDCYVHPYRGEGFGLPIVEAMACGLPVIATGRGPTLDYCADGTAYLLPAEEVPCPYEWPPGLTTAQPTTWFEPDLGELKLLMRHAFDHREEGREIGERARAHVHRSFTWERTRDEVVRRLRAAS
jgi:glycosyltransferase involved in cell wall biosynthesis